MELTNQEEKALDELCALTELTPIQVLRQALRLYQAAQLGRMTCVRVQSPNESMEDLGNQLPPMC
jgi:hypothetical protein